MPMFDKVTIGLLITNNANIEEEYRRVVRFKESCKNKSIRYFITKHCSLIQVGESRCCNISPYTITLIYVVLHKNKSTSKNCGMINRCNLHALHLKT